MYCQNEMSLFFTCHNLHKRPVLSFFGEWSCWKRKLPCRINLPPFAHVGVFAARSHEQGGLISLKLLLLVANWVITLGSTRAWMMQRLRFRLSILMKLVGAGEDYQYLCHLATVIKAEANDKLSYTYQRYGNSVSMVKLDGKEICALHIRCSKDWTMDL